MEKKPQRRRGRRQIKQSQTSFLEPKSQMESCDPFLKQCMKKVRHHSQINMVKNELKGLCGKHRPINYKSEYNFLQGWQSNKNSQEIKRKYSQPINENRIVNTLQSILVALFGLSFWFMSVYRIFEMDYVSFYFAAIVIVAQVIDVAIIRLKQKSDQDGKINMGKTIKKYGFSIVLLLYMAFVIIELELTGGRILALLPLDIVFLAKIYKRLQKLYILLKIRVPAVWRNEMEISQLVIGCLSLVHLFSLILNLAAQTDKHKNWTLSIEEFHNSWQYSYLYSLYFTCSTMFTVGYGDVTPKNMWEISTILVVQVVGIINIGYVINQVGRYVSKINEKEDILYRGISDAQKISEDYKLPDEVSRKLRSYVIDNQIAGARFNVEQQDTFLGKLNDQLRQQVTGFNKFQLVKSNIFFLCHWSSRFQRRIADQLIRKVYSPEQCLVQVQGKEKLFILSQGKINIEANSFSIEGDIYRKVLNTLEIDPKKEVHFNVYGYTSLISGLKVNLRAVSKDYSICYIADKQAILSAITQNQTDFQYFHEIRSRIQQSKCKEAHQAPKIRSTKEHYIPSPYFIIKRQRHQKQGKQKRKSHMRNQFKKKFVIQEETSLKQISFFEQLGKRLSVDNIFADKTTKSQSCLEKLRQKQGYFKRNYTDNNKDRIIGEKFEAGHNFSYFRRKSNRANVLSRYANIYYADEDSQTLLQSKLLLTTMKYNYKTLDEQNIRKIINTKTL